MTRENILFSIIGLLLGLNIGFIFVTAVNQRAGSSRFEAGTGGTDGSELPSNAVKEQGMPSFVQAAIKQARDEPKNFDAQMKAAEIFYQIQRYDEAIEFLTRANQLQPGNNEVVIALGNANYDTGRYEIAEKWYTAALMKDPNNINVRTDLGLTFLLRDNPNIDRAITEFRRSLERDPQHEQTLQNLVVAYTRKGDIAQAQVTLTKLEQVNPGNQALSQLRSSIESARTSTTSAPNTGQR